jgi:hypothetical protein
MSSDETRAQDPRLSPRRSPVPLVLFTVLGLVLLFVFGWYRDWFGRPLSDAQILERLDETRPPREIQHALAQLEARLTPSYPGREAFRSRVAALAGHPLPEVRAVAAWTMGREPAPEYRAALLRLLEDGSAVVRTNAACALSNFGVAEARPHLAQALRPIEFRAPGSGTLRLRARVGDPVSLGRDLGEILSAQGGLPLRAEFNGEILEVPWADGAEIEEGTVYLRVSPDPQIVANVLQALDAVGGPGEIPAVEEVALGRVPGLGEELAARARRTLEILRRR